ncbi:SAM-dependent methyltransferase [Bacillus thuringiensis serovar yunnanensis]|nr:SAM-dependent methyltransferase [Bacillus thuringiensis serovar yunnanensis]
MNHNISNKNRSEFSISNEINQVYEKDLELQYLMNYFQTRKNNRLLDIATEKGTVSEILAPVFEEVITMGLDQVALEKIRNSISSSKYENVSFVNGNTEILPFKECSFDTVICRYAAYYFKNTAHFLREVQRVVVDNGIFILIDNVSPENKHHDKFYNYFEKKRDSGHHYVLKKNNWVSLLEKNGLRIQSCLTYERKNNFDAWCNKLKISKKVRLMLTDYILLTSKEMQGFFNLELENQNIKSFSTESIILICRKTNTHQSKGEYFN